MDASGFDKGKNILSIFWWSRSAADFEWLWIFDHFMPDINSQKTFIKIQKMK